MTRRGVRETLGAILESWGLRLSPAPAHTDAAQSLELYLPVSGEQVLVGKLTQESGQFLFRYSETFKRRSDLPPITAFPDKDAAYESKELWPFFQVRLPPVDRADVREILQRRRIDTNDTLTLLAELGKRAVSGPYEFKLVPAARAAG
jgi:HipA-like protein